jgi:uncharacterized protein with HEPN domain
MRRDNDRILIYDIQRAIARVIEYTAGGRDDFFSKPMVQDAVIRNLEIIGEASNKLSDETKALAPDIDWRRVVGLRNVLIHAYRDVDMKAVWEVVDQELEPLVGTLKRLTSSRPAP